MTQSGELYVGLMSGTSLDGIDAVLIDLASAPTLIAAETFSFSPDLHRELLALCSSGANEIERMGRADRQLGVELGQSVTKLLSIAQVAPNTIKAIGSHGQTIRHRPPHAEETHPFTLQIGDPTSIAELTGITTVADFRRRDIAAGGHGAPLVPAFHRAVFGSNKPRAIVNIGGIANVTVLPGDNKPITGFDTGPGNTLLDHWIQRHHGENFDRDGTWGARGVVVPELLNQLLSDSYFAAMPPKSTGREYFNSQWLDRHLNGKSLRAIDVQATLVEVTARSISEAITVLPFVNEIFICGGGAYNAHLMTRLEALLHPRLLGSTAQLGIAPEWVEAAAFAWLAQQTMQHKPGNEPTVTGAAGYRVLGAIYPA